MNVQAFYLAKLFNKQAFIIITLLLTFNSCKKQDVENIVPAKPPIIISDANLNGWVKNPAGLATVKFVTPPLTPPLGVSSVQLASPDKSFARLRDTTHSGILLSNITELSYSAYVEQRDSTVETTFLVLLIDADGDGISEHNLVFDARYQTGSFVTGGFPNQGITKKGVWQTWDALHGSWFFGPANDPDKGFTPFSLATYLLIYPNAKINNDASKGGGAIRLSGGGPSFTKNFIGYADNFKIGVKGIITTYDFE